MFPRKAEKLIGDAALFDGIENMSNLITITQKFFLFVCFLLTVSVTFAQDEEVPVTREIVSLDFQAQRPAKVNANIGGALPKVSNAKRKKNLAVVTSPKRRYKLINRVPAMATAKISTGVKTVKQALKTEEFGVTFWRLRPATEDETDAPTFSVKIGSVAEEWTAERVGSTTNFRRGDRVRFTVESSRSGFLYIVNREFYTDGTTAEADLIFPTLRTRGGDNRVTAGSLVEIPATSDSVQYFTIKPRREDYAGEEIAVIVSPVKLSGIELGLRAQKIDRPTVEKWLKDWGTTLDIYDAEDGEGIAYTANEQEAATVQSRALTQEEPLPQTIYRVQARPGAPLVVLFRMNAK